MNKELSLKARLILETRSIPVPESGCWLWTGCITKKGYAWIAFKGKRVGGHRLSWEAYKKEIPDGLFVCHKCDTPSCVNPDHLFVGTPADNMKDMGMKGRRKWALPGERHGNSKLSTADVLLIRSGDMTIKEMLNRFPVTRTTLYEIRTWKRWKLI